LIRPATKNDLSKISLIENRVFRFPWSDDQIRWELRSQHVASNYVMLLEDNIIGYIFTHKIDKEVQILNFAIDTSYQHKGYGEEFFSYFMDQLDEDISIILEVRKSNFSAINLYLKFGFSELGIREKYYSDGEDAIVMKRKFLAHGVV
jgi:ribosomal-protein-alanine N-acetyltransferase